jgi:DNA-directed RNA polymerase specialized sigma24 family protein
MANDPKQKAREAVHRSQAKVERGQGQLEQARAARRESFEQARAAGLSLAEIGKAANLHRSRVDQILQGK